MKKIQEPNDTTIVLKFLLFVFIYKAKVPTLVYFTPVVHYCIRELWGRQDGPWDFLLYIYS
jgi:hypothetical protein